jgi:histidinol-phosphate aminotransferase
MSRLDFNEGFYKNPNFVEDLVHDLKAHKYINYMDYSLPKLNQLLGDFHSVDPNAILVYSGSDSAIDSILRVFSNSNSKVAFASLEYSNFKTFLEINHIDSRNFLRLNNDYILEDLNRLLKQKIVDIVYISNPNNPTGKMANQQDLLSLVRQYSQTLFIIDEAYIHFYSVRKPDQDFLLQYAPNECNMIICRTLSKAYSMAGIRSGYIITNPRIINELAKIHNYKNITFFNATAIKRHIIDYDKYMDYVSKIIHNRTVLEKYFLGLKEYFELFKYSHASFIMIKVINKKVLFKKLLLKNNITIRLIITSDLNDYSYYRITVPEDYNIIIDVMEKFLTTDYQDLI